jgi:hypothetical protein
MKQYLKAFSLAAVLAGCAPASQTGLHSSGQSTDQNPGILGGEVLSRVGQYPAQRSVVMIQPLGPAGLPVTGCTAVLIGQNTGLTSAHCLEMEFTTFRVVFGLRMFATAENHLEGARYELHPRYKTEIVIGTHNFQKIPGEQKFTMDRRFDLAIFSFKGTLPPGYRPAHIDIEKFKDRSNEKVYSYGEGARVHPHQITRDDIGDGLYGKLARGVMFIDTKFTQYEDLYFTSEYSPSQVCNGDSGGPQFLADAVYPTIVGIHSARLNNDASPTTKFSNCGDISVITKVAPFSDWIFEKKTELENQLR